MIDCNRTENFIKEKERLCQYYKDKGCVFCVLNRNIKGLSCSDFIAQQPKKAIEVVQKWSNETPPKTLLSEFLKSYPKAKLNSDGYPSDIVPCSLGLIERKDTCKNKCLYYYDNGHPCYDCWDTPVKESEE